MRQYRLWIEIAVVVVVAIAAFLVGRSLPPGPAVSGNANGVAGEQAVSGSLPQSATREDVPADTVVPGRETDVPANVARPEMVIPAAPDTETKKRIFSVAVDSGKFVPDTIVIAVGDIANITFKAVDRDYDIVQPDHGFRLDIAKGESELLEAQFSQPGKYLFYCSSCGGPDAGPRGYLTVVP